MSVGNKIKHLRKSRGLTPTQLAMAAGVPYYTVTHLEKGTQQSTKLINLKSLARVLGVSLEALIDDSMGIEEITNDR
jgi:transcriptional regulator with XRE-family HTH domain